MRLFCKQIRETTELVWGQQRDNLFCERVQKLKKKEEEGVGEPQLEGRELLSDSLLSECY
jgi:hypothetical protein